MRTKNAALIGAMLGALSLLAGCSGGTGSETSAGPTRQYATTTSQKATNASAQRRYTKGLEALFGKETFTANIIAPPPDADEQFDGRTYQHPTIRKPVGSKYVLMTSWGLQGADSQFLVADANGRPAPGVNVEMVTYDAANDTIRAVVPLGTTNADGLLTVR